MWHKIEWVILRHTHFSPVPVMTVTKLSTPLPWPNFFSASAAQLPSLSTQTGRPRASEMGVLRSTEDHSWISLVEWRTMPSCGFTRPPVEIPNVWRKKTQYMFEIPIAQLHSCFRSSRGRSCTFPYQRPGSCSWAAQHLALLLCTSLISNASCPRRSSD